MFKERNKDLLMLPFGRQQQFEIQFETGFCTELECLSLFRSSVAQRIQCMLKSDDLLQASLCLLFGTQKSWNDL